MVLIVVLTALVASLLLLCLGLFLYSHRRKKTDLWPRRGGRRDDLTIDVTSPFRTEFYNPLHCLMLQAALRVKM